MPGHIARLLGQAILVAIAFIFPSGMHAQFAEGIFHRPRPQLSPGSGAYGYFPTTWRPWPGIASNNIIVNPMILTPQLSPAASSNPSGLTPAAGEGHGRFTYPKASTNLPPRSYTPLPQAPQLPPSWQRQALPNIVYPPAHSPFPQTGNANLEHPGVRVHVPPDSPQQDLDNLVLPVPTMPPVIQSSPVTVPVLDKQPSLPGRRIIRIHEPEEGR